MHATVCSCSKSSLLPIMGKQTSMDMTLDTHVGNLVSQGNGILEGLRHELGQLDDPTAMVTRDLVAEGVSAFVAGILETKKAGTIARKATQAYVAGNIGKNRRTTAAKYERLFVGWEDEVVRFLQQVSTTAPRLTTPGNSDKLIRRVRRADRYKRLETRVRHIVTELEAMRNVGLVYNSSLPSPSPKATHADERQDVPNLLKSLEVALRRFIEGELCKVDKDWWQHVPTVIRKNTEGRKRRSEVMWPWHPPTSTNIVDYLDFSDYRLIILEEDNWRSVFVKFFKKPSFVEVWLGELEPIRNDIAHSRPLSPSAVAKLRMLSANLLTCMNSR
jgi:hypothetical protein